MLKVISGSIKFLTGVVVILVFSLLVLVSCLGGSTSPYKDTGKKIGRTIVKVSKAADEALTGLRRELEELK